ncbi:MAG TPA: tetratricopeptide repeat-containing glycosyltransferase family protein [Stellaceae bacterium]|nr:tetratricopeptide repeat-containing glycosyltransferase family protein [Stellaceae bacterium]
MIDPATSPEPVTRTDFQQALAHHQAGRLPQAEACYRRVLAVDPTHAPALHRLGIIASHVGRNDIAAEYLAKATHLQPLSAEYHGDLGKALTGLGRLAEAESCYRMALSLDGGYVAAHTNLGHLYRKSQRLDDAVACFQSAIRLQPDLAEAHHTLGNVFRELERMDEAAACYREVLLWHPDVAEVHYNLGFVLHDLGLLGEAEGCYREAVRLKPMFKEAHDNLGYLLLLDGRLKEAWPEYEWRHRTQVKNGFAARRSFPQAQWTGEALDGRSLLIHAEQGFGDTLQFCRYLPLAAAYGRVVLEVPRPLIRLLTSLPGIDQIVATGDPLPEFGLHCPLLSLPGVFGTTLDTIPARSPYLAAEPSLVAAWRRRVSALPGLRVGLVWAGDPRPHATALHDVDRRRSTTLAQLAPLAEIDGISFISLQKGEAARQVPPAGLALHDWTDELGDFADTAALIETLDLVISVDTAVLHLVGALGKPVWLLNRFDTCWRWLRYRADSPWYPTLRQFRQPRPGDWGGVMRDVHIALQQLATADPRETPDLRRGRTS